MPLLLALVLALGCERSRPEATPAPSTPAPGSEPAPAVAAPALSAGLTRALPKLLVAIGDLHGDLAATRRALRLAGAIDEHDHWSGGALMVVQTGDTIDRGDDDREVLDLLERLRTEARKAGGELILLSGNHELMNVSGDLRYVTPESFNSFSGEDGRRDAFRPGGQYARLFATRPLFVKVGNTVFVHGGIRMAHVAYGLDRLQSEARSWLLGQRASAPAPLRSDDGPAWTRVYGQAPDASACAELAEVLKALEAERMVVGHTVQEGGINAACEGRVYRIDVGLSRFYGGPMQVLALREGAPEVLSAQTP